MPPPLPPSEHADRVARARALMRERGMDGLIVTDPVHYGYFTGHKVPAWQKSRPAILVLPQDGAPALITWSGPEMFQRLYKGPPLSWIEDQRIYPEVPLHTDPQVDWGVADIVRERGLDGATLGIELGRETWLGIPQTDWDLLRGQLPNVRFVDSCPVLWGCRMIKSEWEIDCMREACAVGGRAWGRVFEELRAGIGVPEVQRKVLSYYAEEGADLNSEPPMVFGATGPGRTFQTGDVLYMDGGCSVAGYKMDITRRAVFGRPSARQKAEHDGMWALLEEIIERMTVGTPVRDLFEFSQTRLAARPEWRNYSDHPSKRIGHGIGLENEPPSISGTDMTVLAEGMVLTPEPKIESEDGLVNPEEQVVIRASGPEVISRGSDASLFEVH